MFAPVIWERLTCVHNMGSIYCLIMLLISLTLWHKRTIYTYLKYKSPELDFPTWVLMMQGDNRINFPINELLVSLYNPS